mmetsp:Transcript_66818/g.195367  ORF Transcript_66818/g.195367 Transcript_66818/m.195367 type:complete len:269 (+) Transcript_66818:1771-2577(+)
MLLPFSSELRAGPLQVIDLFDHRHLGGVLPSELRNRPAVVHDVQEVPQHGRRVALWVARDAALDLAEPVPELLALLGHALQRPDPLHELLHGGLPVLSGAMALSAILPAAAWLGGAPAEEAVHLLEEVLEELGAVPAGVPDAPAVLVAVPAPGLLELRGRALQLLDLRRELLHLRAGLAQLHEALLRGLVEEPLQEARHVLGRVAQAIGLLVRELGPELPAGRRLSLESLHLFDQHRYGRPRPDLGLRAPAARAAAAGRAGVVGRVRR